MLIFARLDNILDIRYWRLFTSPKDLAEIIIISYSFDLFTSTLLKNKTSVELLQSNYLCIYLSIYSVFHPDIGRTTVSYVN